jgi:cytidylate kinase
MFVKPKKIIIALDGHSSCGKSTYAKRIAAELGYAYIDSGAMYRAVTLACMDVGLFDSSESPPVKDVEDQLDQLDLDLRFNPEKERTEMFLNNRMVEDLIRSMEVSDHVSFIATLPVVRRKMVEYQRRLGQGKGVVMDGRDIGTVVFPHAEMKIFLTASEEIRAKRRYKELIEKGMPAEFEDVRYNISKRDRIDSSREDSPLKQADDSLVLDNSEMTVEEQMVWFRETFRRLTGAIDG